MGKLINEKQVKILECLAKYKFLNRKQIARLGLVGKNSNLNAHYKGLVEAKFIGEINARQYGLGFVYYMKKRGADNREHERPTEKVSYVKHEPRLQPSTLHHRYGAISCQIELDLAALVHNYKVDFYIRDIDSDDTVEVGSHLSRATRLHLESSILEPDANFLLSSGSSTRLFAFEFENQTHTARSMKKLLNHIEALETKALGRKYKLFNDAGTKHKAHRVLCVYEKENVMKSVMKKMYDMDAAWSDGMWFLFKTMKEVVEGEDYFEGWRTLGGQRVNMML